MAARTKPLPVWPVYGSRRHALAVIWVVVLLSVLDIYRAPSWVYWTMLGLYMTSWLYRFERDWHLRGLTGGQINNS